MSIQSARDFLTKLAKDEKFRTALQGCKTGADQQQFAVKAGFQFTGEEFRAARGELQDRELDGISGGIDIGPPGCPLDRWSL